MSEDLLARAARALREETADSPAEPDRTRARILARLDEERARRRRRLAIVLPLAATFLAGTVFGASGGRGAAFVERVSEALGISADEEETPSTAPTDPARSRAQTPRMPAPAPTEPGSSMPAAPAAPEISAAATSAPAAPIVAARTPHPVPPMPAPTTGAVSTTVPEPQALEPPSPDDALYREAHHVHFALRDSARALGAWDRYLAAAPAGRFALEARYNRAICLVRLGRTAEARAALEPFASGSAGGYRRAEAAELLQALDR